MEISARMTYIILYSLILSVTCDEQKKNHRFIGGLVDKVVPDFVQNLFGKGNDKGPTEIRKDEGGSLDFFGRDVLRGITNFVSSNKSQGLDCDKSFAGEVLDVFKDKVSLIYPGTKWCGGGDISKNGRDLGTFADTDKCCRAHDMCFSSIPAGETKFGLENTGLFTRSHCDCDQEFYNCLKQVNSIISYKLGTTYFSILGPQCFKKDYPITECNQKKNGKCIDYEVDESKPEEYQWFDSPKF